MHSKYFSEHRLYERSQVPLLIQFRVHRHEEFHTDYALNISAGGVYLYMPRPPSLGALIEIQFILRDLPQIIHCQARVIRVDSTHRNFADFIGCALRFVDLSEEDMALIDSIVQKYNALKITPQ